MVAPEVAHARLTCTEPLKVPPLGLIVGVAAVGVVAADRVKVALATALLVWFKAVAMARTVALLLRVNGPV